MVHSSTRQQCQRLKTGPRIFLFPEPSCDVVKKHFRGTLTNLATVDYVFNIYSEKPSRSSTPDCTGGGRGEGGGGEGGGDGNDEIMMQIIISRY